MNKLLISMLVALALAGCGGGGSDSGAGGAAEPPASEMPGEEDADDSGAAPEQPVALSAECVSQPANVVNAGQTAMATIKFNQPVNTTAKVTSMCSAGPTLFANQSINVVLGQGSVSQKIPGSCTGGSYQVNFEVAEHDITKSCTWTVPILAVVFP